MHLAVFIVRTEGLLVIGVDCRQRWKGITAIRSFCEVESVYAAGSTTDVSMARLCVPSE